MKLRSLGAVAGAAVALGAGSTAWTRTAAPGTILRGPFGSGGAAVWTLRGPGRPRSVVVFLHGWKLQPPSREPWVGQFRPWLDHLALRGSDVVFPAYQIGGGGQGPQTVAWLRRGIGVGLARLGRPRLPVVAVGYSYGGALAFYYAANAKRWGLPVPRAVDSVFPSGEIAGAQLPPLPVSVRVLIEVGDRDDVAGRSGADTFWAWVGARASGIRRYVVVRSRGGFVASHAAPKTTSAAARHAFWSPLDALVEAVLRTDSRR